MYYTAVNYKSNKFGNPSWTSKDYTYQIYDFQGRWELIRFGYKLAQLINGKDSLDKYYKGDVQNWIEKTKKKDLLKAKKIKQQAQKAIEDAEFIEKLWQINEVN